MKRLSHSILAVSFLTSITLGFLGTLNQWNPYFGPINENRTIAGKPEFSIQDIGKTIAQTDQYLADNFGFRKFMIRSHALIRHFVFNAYSAENRILEKLGVKE